MNSFRIPECVYRVVCISDYKCITPLESSTRKGLAATAQLGASKNGGCIKKKACILATIFVAKVEPLWDLPILQAPQTGISELPINSTDSLIRWCWSLETVSNVKWRHARGTKKSQDCDGETARLVSLILSKSWYHPHRGPSVLKPMVTTGDPPL